MIELKSYLVKTGKKKREVLITAANQINCCGKSVHLFADSLNCF